MWRKGMPKLKTHRGAAKRFKVTATGKIKRHKGYKSHLLTGKPAKRTRSLRTAALVSDSDHKNIKTLLPYL
jgi:large subunit ribosomal protein L35